MHKLIFKKILVFFVSLIVCFSFVCVSVHANEADESNNYKLLNLSTLDGFKSDMVNPYGYHEGKKFLISEENELFVYKSWDCDSKLETSNQRSYWL